MGCRKGQTNNPHGRPRGSRNKINIALRTRINKFLSDNWPTIMEDFKVLEPAQRIILFEKMLKYSIPQLKSLDLQLDFTQMDEATLDYIIENLMLKIKKDE
jgi:hypothetical protein